MIIQMIMMLTILTMIIRNELDEEEQADDPHADWLLGPFESDAHEVSWRRAPAYYFSLEANEFAWSTPEVLLLLL